MQAGAELRGMARALDACKDWVPILVLSFVSCVAGSQGLNFASVSFLVKWRE